MHNTTSSCQKKQAPFFRDRPTDSDFANLTIHNFSTYNLSAPDVKLLSKGLSFVPTPRITPEKMHIELLRNYDKFARSLRLQYINQRKNDNKDEITESTQSTNTLTSVQVYRPMKFLTKPRYITPNEIDSGFGRLENFIEITKVTLDEQLPHICKPEKSNLPPPQRKSLFNLKKQRMRITIKPADKNLGIVIMDTDDYISQCTEHLNSNTYRLVDEYPSKQIERSIEAILNEFKPSLFLYNKRLYHFLRPKPVEGHVPKFYGIPKIHKKFLNLPPLRPIVAQCNSMLAPSAKFIDHVLQPLSQSYSDYLHNSTSLITLLEDLHVPDEAILVTVDVESLYPSIPQSECLDIIYNEMQENRQLMLFDPNLIIKLLHSNVTNNYFSFATYTFQQTTGTAMGAAFSPTIANIFMSIFIHKFLNTQKHQPQLIKRYIDDIFLIWTHGHEELKHFLTDLNQFHPSIRFTYHISDKSVDFLDLTIFKGIEFEYSNILDLKTYQKPLNLYQYLHYSSNHPKSVYKGLIRGECIRYLRTNTIQSNFNAMISIFKMRLLQRGYPKKLVDKYTSTVQFSQRQKHIQHIPTKVICKTPIFSCLPPPQYNQLKTIILQGYSQIQGKVTRPRFIFQRHKSLGQELVKAETIPTDEQLVDMAVVLQVPHSPDTSDVRLPILRATLKPISPCNNNTCLTCKVHLDYRTSFKCTRTSVEYPIRHHFTCNSTNLVYLITCTKCCKQYVGITTRQLKVRINHHRTNIIRKLPIYISKHFNLPDHTLQNLKVQPIDKANSYDELHSLEQFWIKILKTLQPSGLNVKL